MAQAKTMPMYLADQHGVIQVGNGRARTAADAGAPALEASSASGGMELVSSGAERAGDIEVSDGTGDPVPWLLLIVSFASSGSPPRGCRRTMLGEAIGPSEVVPSAVRAVSRTSDMDDVS